MSVSALLAEHWIWHENLFRCLTLAANSAGVGFVEQDWSAIRQGLSGTSDLTDTWFEYVLSRGEHRLLIAIALDDGDTSTGIVHLKFLDIPTEQDAFHLAEILQFGTESN